MPRLITLIACLLLALPAFALETGDPKTKLPDDKVMGKASAKVTLIEYASLSCPHCAKFHADILPVIQKEYIDTGKVRLIFRDFPLNAPALAGSKVSQCAAKQGDDKYYTVLKALFAAQKEWAFETDFQPKLIEVAKKAGMAEKAVKSCLEDKALEEKILASRKGGEALGVNSTPSIFFNGVKAEVHSADDARKALETVLAGKTLDQEEKEAAKTITIARPNDMVLGQDKAKVTVVEYSSFSTCPHCGTFHQKLVGALQKDYIDTGKVKVVYRGLPNNSAAFYAYMMAYCKGPAESFNILSLLVDDIKSWATTHTFLSPLRAISQKAGFSNEQFNACLENKEIENLILSNAREANEKLGIKGSPYVYVNGVQVAQTEDPELVIKDVDAALGKRK